MIITVDLNHISVPEFEAVCDMSNKVVRCANQVMIHVINDEEIKKLAMIIRGPHKIIEASDHDLKVFTFSRKD